MIFKQDIIQKNFVQELHDCWARKKIMQKYQIDENDIKVLVCCDEKTEAVKKFLQHEVENTSALITLGYQDFWKKIMH